MIHRTRPATDFQGEIAPLYQASFGRPWDGVVAAEDELWEWLAEDGRVASWLTLRRKSLSEFYIAYGGCSPGYQGQGARGFKRLLEILGAMAPKASISLITAWDNADMQILALKLGFKFYGTMPGRAGQYEIQWARRL